MPPNPSISPRLLNLAPHQLNRSRRILRIKHLMSSLRPGMLPTSRPSHLRAPLVLLLNQFLLTTAPVDVVVRVHGIVFQLEVFFAFARADGIGIGRQWWEVALGVFGRRVVGFGGREAALVAAVEEDGE